MLVETTGVQNALAQFARGHLLCEPAGYSPLYTLARMTLNLCANPHI